jgi:hypothetical protein
MQSVPTKFNTQIKSNSTTSNTRSADLFRQFAIARVQSSTQSSSTI